MTLHHANGPDCPLCSQKIDTMDPRLQSWADWVRIKFPDCHISWGFRGKEDQDAAFVAGRTRAKWPNSKHNAMNGDVQAAVAFDIFQILENGDASFDIEYCTAVAQALKDEGAPIEWAGSWVGFHEYDHFQLVER